ncbi:hypothetical protein BST79_gp131 [Only Syngen Nebraska virus 5]|uniref:hypothetical protein n=1 Tax=Only Syngen Nebraska virus 5 TaxID=1917232 RepID=UPI000900DAB1|nr:hypothetical protein BST79_gp131 [Only Syngen Nebraska virus 5]APC25644.1 hypothetical protein [Only Syngen Nebraska virus 5]
MKTYDIKLHRCGCGYETTHDGNASRHKKSSCGHEMKSEVKEFVFKDEDNNELKHTIRELRKETEKLHKETEKLHKENKKLKLQFVYDDEDDTTDDEGIYPGLVYYIVNKESPFIGKVGRTSNTDIKKLKTRYSIYIDPIIMCFYSTDIRDAEKKLKDAMKASGCMNTERGKESIHHSEISMAVFHRAVLESQ